MCLHIYIYIYIYTYTYTYISRPKALKLTLVRDGAKAAEVIGAGGASPAHSKAGGEPIAYAHVMYNTCVYLSLSIYIYICIHTHI